MRRGVRRLLGVLGFAVGVAGVALAVLPELRTFALLRMAPTQARDALLVRLRGANGDVFLLGTIHGDHLITAEYGLEHVEAVVTHLRPARLLVESLPAELAAGHLADGPIEMAFAHLVGRASGAEVRGIDWVASGPAGRRRTDDTRDDHMVENVLGALDPAGPTLVLVGYAHVPEFVERLTARGFVEVPLTPDEKTALFDPVGLSKQYPAGLAAAVEDRITRDETRLAGEGDPGTAERLRDAITARRAFLETIRAVGERPGTPHALP